MNFRSFVLFVTFAVASFSAMSAQTAAAHKTTPAPKKTTSSGKSTAPVKKASVAASPKTGSSSTAKKTTPSASRTTKSANGKAPVKRASYQPRQAAPTPDRLREIQSALIGKGYLKGEPSGVWDAESMDAMKRYQMDEKQDPSGKITAASLIGLGLGPRPAAFTPSPQAPSQPPVADLVPSPRP